MGYIRHEAVIVTLGDWDKAGIEALCALQDELPEEYRKYVLGPVVGVNGYTTFVLVPDGSKEGWEESDAMDNWRERFINAAKRSKYPDLVHLQFGGDDDETIIRHTTDNEVKALPRAVMGEPEE